MKRLGLKSYLGMILLIGIFSCEPELPFGPVYDFAGNLARDRVVIEEFLQDAPIDSLYRIHDPSGVVIIVQEEGEGINPQGGNVIYTNYVGRLLDGTVFDSNIEEIAVEHNIFDPDRNYRIFQFILGGREVINGWNIGFRRMKSGSKGIFLIPSPEGYQDSESIGLIPPNSVLMFEIEFLGLD